MVVMRLVLFVENMSSGTCPCSQGTCMFCCSTLLVLAEVTGCYALESTECTSSFVQPT